MDWIKDIQIRDIASDHMQAVAEYCGISDAISLMINLQGIEIYVPIAGRKIMAANYISENFTGKNTSSIATHLGIDRAKVIKLSKRAPDERDILINAPMRAVAEHCGKDVAIRLMQNFPRRTIYVPKDGFSIARRRYIERAFTGSNVLELALKCQVTERHIRQVINEMYSSRMKIDLFAQNQA